ncbi:MAG TPA: ATP-binding protein, partial [Longimicrobiales bacterium]|nr:ATP-binding protein [Longimicrobiales bacterium]
RLNSQWQAVLGTDDEDVDGGWLARVVHPDDRGAASAVLAKVEAGETIRDFRCRLCRSDGEWRWFEWNLLPTGKQVYVAGRDITDRVALREALSLSEERYRQVFEASPLPTWIFDRKTLSFLAVNDAAVAHYGWSREEFLTMTIRDIRPAEEVERLHGAVAATPQDGLHYAGLWRHRTRDGRILHVEVSAHRIPFLGREAELVVANDVTARMQAEDQLHQAQRMESVGRLAGGIAHDFNNLLTIIGNLTALAHDGLSENDPARGLLDEVQAAQRRGAALTRQLLTFSRQEPADAMEAVDLTRTLGEMAGLFRPLMGAEVTVHLDLPPEPVVVKIPPVRLEQVVMNLAVNARDAMPRGGEFHVGLRAEGVPEAGDGMAVLNIRDSGPGIPPGIVDRIFDPFYTTKPPHQGTGLGLSTAYGIVSAAGGTIHVVSGPGEGAEFEVRLPLSSDVPTRPPATDGVRSRVQLDGRKARVLVVEDELALQRAIQMGLTRQGYEVEAASDGREALRVLEALPQPVDIVVTDMVLPGMDGLELVRALRKTMPDIRVLVISGYAGDRPEVEEFLSREHFLAKPFTLEKLGETLQAILARKG